MYASTQALNVRSLHTPNNLSTIKVEESYANVDVYTYTGFQSEQLRWSARDWTPIHWQHRPHAGHPRSLARARLLNVGKEFNRGSIARAFMSRAAELHSTYSMITIEQRCSYFSASHTHTHIYNTNSHALMQAYIDTNVLHLQPSHLARWPTL